MSEIVFNTSNYTDIQGLKTLKAGAQANSKETAKQMAGQFEALLVQMMMSSMRQASAIFSEEDGHSAAFSTYQDLFDKQVALSVKDLGFATQIERYLERVTPKEAPKDIKKQKPTGFSIERVSRPQPSPVLSLDSPKAFVSSLWDYAKEASEQIGLNPKVLLAQAALETGWGKKIIKNAQNSSSHNLFNIKANSSWDKSIVKAQTIEHREGVLQKETASFRAYPSFKESFTDYVNFISNNPRYSQAVEKAREPKQYLEALQQAHYATDPNYSTKILDLYNSKPFQSLFEA